MIVVEVAGGRYRVRAENASLATVLGALQNGRAVSVERLDTASVRPPRAPREGVVRRERNMNLITVGYPFIIKETLND